MPRFIISDRRSWMRLPDIIPCIERSVCLSILIQKTRSIHSALKLLELRCRNRLCSLLRDLVIYDPHAQKDQCCYDDVRHQKYYLFLHLYAFFPAVSNLLFTFLLSEKIIFFCTNQLIIRARIFAVRIVTAVCGNNSIIPEKSR